MPLRRRPAVLTGGLTGALLALALLTGCSTDADRAPGAPVTEAEAAVLAGLLARNTDEGGADFVVTAPYAEDTLLTLTGEVDFTDAVGRAQAVFSYGDDDRPDDARTVFFTRDDLWFGDLPALAETLTGADLPPASFVRLPSAVGEDEPSLTDVLVQLVLNLSADESDDPGAFTDGDYTWQGQRSIDGQLTDVYGSTTGWTVAVASSSDLLVQFVTRLPGEAYDVTVSLADHGTREIAPPGPEESVDGTAHPEVRTALGL